MNIFQAVSSFADGGSVVTAEAGRSQLLMLAYYFPPMSESGALRPYRFAKYLSQFGFATAVVTASEPGPTPLWNDVIAVPEREDGWRREGLKGWAAMVLHRLLPYNDRLRWVPSALTAAGATISGGTVRAIISTSPPVATHLAALLLKERYGLPWVADFRDPVAGNPFRCSWRARRLDRYIERRIITSADAVIANTNHSAEALRSRYPKHAHKIQLIWNGYDPELSLHPLPPPRRAHRVVLHAGSLYGGRHPGALLRAMDRLFNRGDMRRGEVHLRLVGSFEQSARWVEQCELDRLVSEGWVECVEQIPHQEAQKEMREADVLLLLDLNESAASLQLPGKLFEYIRTGKPILAFTTRNSSAEHILSRSGVSHCCVYQDDAPLEVEQRVLRFLQDSGEPRTPSLWFRENFDGVAQARTLADILRTLL